MSCPQCNSMGITDQGLMDGGSSTCLSCGCICHRCRKYGGKMVVSTSGGPILCRDCNSTTSAESALNVDKPTVRCPNCRAPGSESLPCFDGGSSCCKRCNVYYHRCAGENNRVVISSTGGPATCEACREARNPSIKFPQFSSSFPTVDPFAGWTVRV